MRMFQMAIFLIVLAISGSAALSQENADSLEEPKPSKHIRNKQVYPDSIYIKKAYEFWTEHKSMSGKARNYDNLELQRVTRDKRGNVHVHFHPTIKGIKVEGSRVTFRFRSDGTLYDKTWEIIAVATPPPTSSSITGYEAKRIVSAGISDKVFGKPSLMFNEPEQKIIKLKGKDVLVWSVPVSNVPPEYYSWEYIVDANSGEILDKRLATRVDKRQ